jgi:hypothetical protein
MHIEPHIRQPDGDSSSHRGFTDTTFAHQHNQAVSIAGDFINQVRE